MVALMEKTTSPPSFFCGGVLVSRNKVLTGELKIIRTSIYCKFTSSHFYSAAHCIQNKDQRRKRLMRDTFILFGAYDLSEQYQTGTFSESPTDVFIHPDWNPSNQRYDADIAALLMEDDILYTKYIRPICLPQSDLTAKEGYVTGWGESEDTSKVHENIPKEIKIPIHANEFCFLESAEFTKISSPRTFCGGARNISGPCRGDSGGGVFVKVGNVFYLKGIVAASLMTISGQCDVTNFALYTNVEKFIDWIEDPTGFVPHPSKPSRKLNPSFTRTPSSTEPTTTIAGTSII